jgi:hypothetical protein
MALNKLDFVRVNVACIWNARQLLVKVQGGSNVTGTNCDLFTHKSSRSYLNHLVFYAKLQTNRNLTVEELMGFAGVIDGQI